MNWHPIRSPLQAPPLVLLCSNEIQKNGKKVEYHPVGTAMSTKKAGGISSLNAAQHCIKHSVVNMMAISWINCRKVPDVLIYL